MKYCCSRKRCSFVLCPYVLLILNGEHFVEKLFRVFREFMEAISYNSFLINEDITGNAYYAKVFCHRAFVVKDYGKGHLVLLLYLAYSLV